MSKPVKFLVFAIMPLLLLLTGCEVAVKTTVKSETESTTTVEVSFPKAFLGILSQSAPPGFSENPCESLKDQMFNSVSRTAKNSDIKVTDKSSNDKFRCLMELPPGFANDVKVELKDDKYTLTMNPIGNDFINNFKQDAKLFDANVINFYFEFTMPGKILEVKGTTAKPQDNNIKIKWNELSPNLPLEIVSKKPSSHTLILFLGLIIVVLLILLVLFLIFKNRKPKATPLPPNQATQSGYPGATMQGSPNAFASPNSASPGSFTQSSYPQEGFPPAGQTQPNYIQPDYSQSGYVPQDYAQPGYPQPSYPQPDFGADGLSQQTSQLGYPQAATPWQSFPQTGTPTDSQAQMPSEEYPRPIGQDASSQDSWPSSSQDGTNQPPTQQ